MIKVLGLASGALFAALAVWGFNTWRHVSDDDRLTSLLADHCLPYVMDGTTPFEDLGRTPGVYDAADLRDNWTDGGAVIVFENRFVAQWGVSPDAQTPARVCEVKASYAKDTVAGFVVDPDGFVARYTDVIATVETLVPEVEILESGPRTLGWFGADRPQSEGLRVVMIASPGLVSSVIAVRDLD